MEKVFIDTDVVLDLLSGRKPHNSFAEELFSLADQGSFQLFVSSLTFANVNYILSKQFTIDQARKKLLNFKTLVSVLPVNDKIIERALGSDFKNFEDAIQYFTAIEGSLTTLLTRNLKDFKKVEIVVLTPEQFLKSID